MPAWTMHDLRRSLVTGLNEQGIAATHIIEALVNGVSGLRGSIAGVYNRASYLEERRRALAACANLVVAPVAANGNVISMLKTQEQ